MKDKDEKLLALEKAIEAIRSFMVVSTNMNELLICRTICKYLRKLKTEVRNGSTNIK